MNIETTTKWYGKGSLKMYRKTKNIISPVVKKIKDNDGKYPCEFEPKVDDFNASFGAYSFVWMRRGYIFKWSRHFRTPDALLSRLIVPTVVITFKTRRKRGRFTATHTKCYLIVQKKIFGSADYYNSRTEEWGNINSLFRYYRWHNIVSWFAKGTNFVIPRFNWKCGEVPDIQYRRWMRGRQEVLHYFQDVHAENIGLDNGQLKVLDW